MEVTVLTVADCPNGPVIEDRLAEALAGQEGVSVIRRVIGDDADARRFGMRGSPTLLIDGVDPFAPASAPFSMSCRMYRTEDGVLDGAPSVTALHRALRESPAAAGILRQSRATE